MSGAAHPTPYTPLGLTSLLLLTRLIRRRLHNLNPQPSDSTPPTLININGSHLKCPFYPNLRLCACVRVYINQKAKQREREGKCGGAGQPTITGGYVGPSTFIYTHSHLLCLFPFHQRFLSLSFSWYFAFVA